MGKFHAQIHHKTTRAKAEDASHTENRHNPKKKGKTDKGLAVKDAQIIRIFDINRGASVLLLTTIAAMMVRQVKAPPVEPTIGAVNSKLPFFDPKQEIVRIPASQFCDVHEDVHVNMMTQATVCARYRSLTSQGPVQGAFVCGESKAHIMKSYSPGAIAFPSTGRYPLDLPGYAIKGLFDPNLLAKNHYSQITGQTWGEFQVECQNVIDWCGR